VCVVLCCVVCVLCVCVCINIRMYVCIYSNIYANVYIYRTGGDSVRDDESVRSGGTEASQTAMLLPYPTPHMNEVQHDLLAPFWPLHDNAITNTVWHVLQSSIVEGTLYI